MAFVRRSLFDPDAGISTHPRGMMFGACADKLTSDRQAHSRQISTSFQRLTEVDEGTNCVAGVVAVGTEDNISVSHQRCRAGRQHAAAFESAQFSKRKATIKLHAYNWQHGRALPPR